MSVARLSVADAPAPFDPGACGDWDRVVVSFSGGKDSLACVLDLLDRGVPKRKIELWHQNIDGKPGGPRLMDWPVTHAYVLAVGRALGLPVLLQWKDGGFEGELRRDNEPSAGVYFQTMDGETRYLPPARPKNGTRLRFPQVSPDLSVRWCSAYLKIDVATRALNNDPRFIGARTLFVTGERAQESANRAKYRETEPHRTHSERRRRHVLQWRSILRWDESRVWACIESHLIRPHPAYYLGFGRVSCMFCIFGDRDQWHTVRELDPAGFDAVATLERAAGLTIRRGESVGEAASAGQSTIPAGVADYRALAAGTTYPLSFVKVVPPEVWLLPAGAYKRCGGPV